MTKDKTVTMSRELAEDLLNPCADFATHDRLRAILDAPVVERQEPVAVWMPEVVELLKDMRLGRSSLLVTFFDRIDACLDKVKEINQ
jgi:hypothetical protein